MRVWLAVARVVLHVPQTRDAQKNPGWHGHILMPVSFGIGANTGMTSCPCHPFFRNIWHMASPHTRYMVHIPATDVLHPDGIKKSASRDKAREAESIAKCTGRNRLIQAWFLRRRAKSPSAPKPSTDKLAGSGTINPATPPEVLRLPV